jgi:dethiobiotin synthetase
MKGVFVTGTDTAVGKTLVACAWIHAVRRAGMRCGAMKPIAAGGTEDTDAILHALGWPAERASLVTPILLREPIAPHIAARLENRTIDAAAALERFARIAKESDYVVVEGVGGFCVPLGDAYDTVDLARGFALPVVMVVGMRLGCLNHALLTAQAIERAGLRLAGWAANCITPSMPYRDENIDTLVRRLAAPHVGTIPYMESPDAEHASHHLRIAAARGP